MAGYFDIPQKDQKKGLKEILDQIDRFVEDPDNSKLNASFGIDEPTAVLQAAAETTEYPDNDETQVVNNPGASIKKNIFIKLVIVIIAITISITAVHFIVGF